MGVDHGGGDVAVAEELLDGADVVAAFEEVGGEGVAEGVAGDSFGEVRFGGRSFDGALEDAFVEVVAVFGVVSMVFPAAGGGKDPLPDPGFARRRDFSVDGVGEPDGAEAGFQVGVVELSYAFEVIFQ